MSRRFAWIALGFLAVSPFARALTIFDARKTLSLSDSDPVYRDFYINGGSESGLKVGQIITVKRRLTLYDTYENRTPGDLQVVVGKIKVIHVQKGLSVARLQSYPSRDKMPLLEDAYIMAGDQLDLGAVDYDDKESDNVESPDKPIGRSPAEAPPAPKPVSLSAPPPQQAPAVPKPE